jgi:hypothetical protein
MLKDNLKNLTNKLSDIFTVVNDNVITRKRKLTFTDLFYFICRYETVYNDIILNLNVTKITIIQLVI